MDSYTCASKIKLYRGTVISFQNLVTISPASAGGVVESVIKHSMEASFIIWFTNPPIIL
jgi:hypothetical protein